MISKADMLDLTAKIQMDLRDLSARVIELRAWIAAAQLPEATTEFTCPICGISRPTEEALHDHLTNVHAADPPQTAKGRKETNDLATSSG